MMRMATSVFLSALFCSAVWAQADRGTMRGIVKDTTGAVVPNASVTAVNIATNNEFSTISGASTGEFTIPSLPGGNYLLRVTHPGFKTFIQGGIDLAAGGTSSLDVELRVGAAAETIEVKSEVSQVQTDTARVATAVSTAFVDELPLAVNGGVRSPIDLANTTSDVQGAAGNFRIGGGQRGLQGMTLDGVTVSGSTDLNTQNAAAQSSPSIDSLAEFSVESGGFKAETGHASGGSISFVSKSGTNKFHGDVYEYLRNYDMDARSFFATFKPVLKQNDFGFTAGGPITIPKLYSGKDRTFWFFSYEGFRNRVGASVTPLSVPTPEMYKGDFSNFVDGNNKQYKIYDPSSQVLNATTGAYTRTPFPDNIIPESKFDPVAAAIVKYAAPLAVPNVPGLVPGTAGYIRQNYRIPSNSGTRAPVDKWSIKLDQALSKKQHAAFYYGRGTSASQVNPGGIGGLGLTNSLPGGLSNSSEGSTYWRVYRLTHEFTISPSVFNRITGGKTVNVFNVAGVGYLKGSPMSFGLTPLNTVGWKSLGICIPNWPDCNTNFPQINFGDTFTSWGSQDTNTQGSVNWELRNDLTWVKGRHTFKFGGFYNNTIYNGGGSQNYSGNVSFSSTNTGLPNVTSQATGGGSGFASFLLGQDSGWALDTLRLIQTHWISEAAYAQDDWRVSERLTLNLGLRYERGHAPTVVYDQQSDLDPTLPNAGAGGLPGALIFAGKGPGRTGSRTLIPNWNGAVSPRFGFAYSINSKTTLRGSASETFGPIIQNANSSHNVGFIQRITAANTSQGLLPTFLLKDGAPYWSPVPNLDPSVGNGVNMPYYNGKTAVTPSEEYNFAFDIQRQITKTVAVDAGYVGTMAGRIASTLLTFNALDYRNLPANLSPFTAGGKTLLNSLVGSAAANAAGIKAPWAGFNALWGNSATVLQSLLPFPQFSTIDTFNGGGDKIGHSTYHAGSLKITKRFSHGFTMQGSYVFSKYLTNADAAGPQDPFNRSLSKALATTDQTHQVKVSYTYDLPFGKGRMIPTRGIVDAVVGGWRIAGNNTYLKGTPIAVTTTVSFPLGDGTFVNTPTIATYDGWGDTYSGKFDPNVNRFFQPASFFGTQPTTQFGNATRTNPKLRNFPTLNENISLAKAFAIHESVRAEFRGEAFNLLNRTQFGPASGALSLQNANFGLWNTQANAPRTMQLALKVYF
jgi:outer membrane receptor protein involved in Fe transport